MASRNNAVKKMVLITKVLRHTQNSVKNHGRAPGRLNWLSIWLLVSAQVMVSQVTRSNPASGSVLTVQTLLGLPSLAFSLYLSPTHMHVPSLSPSQINLKKKKNHGNSARRLREHSKGILSLSLLAAQLGYEFRNLTSTMTLTATNGSSCRHSEVSYPHLFCPDFTASLPASVLSSLFLHYNSISVIPTRLPIYRHHPSWYSSSHHLVY